MIKVRQVDLLMENYNIPKKILNPLDTHTQHDIHNFTERLQEEIQDEYSELLDNPLNNKTVYLMNEGKVSNLKPETLNENLLFSRINKLNEKSFNTVKPHLSNLHAVRELGVGYNQLNLERYRKSSVVSVVIGFILLAYITTDNFLHTIHKHDSQFQQATTLNLDIPKDINTDKELVEVDKPHEKKVITNQAAVHIKPTVTKTELIYLDDDKIETTKKRKAETTLLEKHTKIKPITKENHTEHESLLYSLPDGLAINNLTNKSMAANPDINDGSTASNELFTTILRYQEEQRPFSSLEEEESTKRYYALFNNGFVLPYLLDVPSYKITQPLSTSVADYTKQKHLVEKELHDHPTENEYKLLQGEFLVDDQEDDTLNYIIPEEEIFRIKTGSSTDTLLTAIKLIFPTAKDIVIKNKENEIYFSTIKSAGESVTPDLSQQTLVMLPSNDGRIQSRLITLEDSELEEYLLKDTSDTNVLSYVLNHFLDETHLDNSYSYLKDAYTLNYNHESNHYTLSFKDTLDIDELTVVQKNTLINFIDAIQSTIQYHNLFATLSISNTQQGVLNNIYLKSNLSPIDKYIY